MGRVAFCLACACAFFAIGWELSAVFMIGVAYGTWASDD